MDQLDPYYLLSVPLAATADEIRAAYRRRAAECHPDIHPPEKRAWALEQMKQLNAARDLLLDPVRRARYDQRMRLEMQKAMWRAKRDAYEPPPMTADPPDRPRARGGWVYGWLMIIGVLALVAPVLLLLTNVPVDPAQPITLVVGLARCAGGLFLAFVLTLGLAYALTLVSQSLRR